MNAPALEIENVVKSFGAGPVLGGVSISVRRGAILGLCGENGAGKSTLLRCVAGALRPDRGRLVVAGRSPEEARASGICRLVPQEFELVPEMSVTENAFLGRERSRFGLLLRREMREKTAELLALVGARCGPDDSVASLGVAEKQKVEIARAFLDRAEVMLFDEPTTVLDREETEALFAIMRKFARDGGTILYVSHKLPEVLEICDEVAVLRDGSLVARGPSSGFTPATLAESMVGRPLGGLFPKRPVADDADADVALSVEGLSSADGRVRRATLRVRPGRVVALSGLAGAGRTELLETICGIRSRRAGEVRVRGAGAVRFSGMHDALRAGVALVPEDRQGAGLFPDFSVAENICIAMPDAPLRGGVFVDRARRDALAGRLVEALRLRGGSIESRAGSLSGGNQQKTVLAKALAARPKVLLVDEPTRGVDVGARAEIYATLRALADDGMAVVMATSDLSEALGLADEIVVMRDGETCDPVPAATATEAQIMRLAHGV